MKDSKAFAVCVLAFLALATSGLSQTITYVVDSFDPAGTGSYAYSTGQITNVWSNWFGDAFRSVSWDPASDANADSSSGSMKITAVFDGQGAIPNQFEVFDGFNGISPPLSGSRYTNFQCDIRFDPNSAKVTVGGTPIFGHLEFGVQTNYGQAYFGSVDVPASNTNWVHVSINLNPNDPALTNIADVLIHIFGPYYGPGLSGTTLFWMDNIKFVGPAPVDTNCVVDWTDVHQRIDGFGASSAWRGSWTTTQADMFFSTNTGIGLSLLRNRIAPDGTAIEAGIMQMAQDRGAKVWSTPWSPPAQYKTTNSVNGGQFASSASNYQGYADQLAAYVATMRNSYGVNIYAISVQNEPDYDTTYESCVWSAQQIHDFLPYLATALTNYGVASTKIMIAEDANWKFDLTAAAMADTNTEPMVGVLAAHSYGSSAAPVNSYGKPLWETEVSTLGGGYDGSISEGLGWAAQIHSFLTYAEVNAWHYWWLIPFGGDDEGLTDTNGVPAKRMYVLGNYSRFVRPGYYRIGVSNNAFTSISAYKDPASGCFAIVAINTGSTSLKQTFNLTGFTASTVTPWVTSGTLSLASQQAVNITNSAFTYSLPPFSVVTFVGQAANNTPTLAISNSGSQFTLTVNGLAGMSYTLWTSTNLVDWRAMLTTNPLSAPFTLTDTNAAGPARFYRVQLGP